MLAPQILKATQAPNFRKLVIILGVLLLALLLGTRANLSLLTILLISGLAVIGIVLLNRQPAWGILAIIPISFLGHYRIPTGTNVAIYGTFLVIPALATIWLLHGMLIRREARLVASSLTLPAFVFMGVVTIALVIGNAGLFPQAREQASFFAQLGGYGLYVFSILLMILVGNLLPDLRWLRAMTWLFMLFGGIYIFGAAFPQIGRFIIGLFQPVGVGGNPFGSVFWTFAATMTFGQVLINRKLHPRLRFLMILLLAAEFYRSFFVNRVWVSGWLPPLIAVLTILWLRNWRWGLATILIGGLASTVLFPEIYSSIIANTQDYSAISRTWTWSIMYEIIKASPILGLGLANYYYYTSLFSIQGWYVSFNSHNNYIDIIAQTGLLGLIAFMWLIFAITRLAWQLRKKSLDPFSMAYVYSCLGGLAGMLFSGLLGDWFLPFLYNIGTTGFRTSVFAWLFFGGLIVIDRAYAQQET